MAHYVRYYACGKHIQSQCWCADPAKHRETSAEPCPICDQRTDCKSDMHVLHDAMAAAAVAEDADNRTVYKYTIPITDHVTIDLPVGAQVLSVGVQKGVNVQGYPEAMCLWALVRPKGPTEKRRFRIFGTGHPIKPGDLLFSRFLGTVMLEGGALVFHVFEVAA